MKRNTVNQKVFWCDHFDDTNSGSAKVSHRVPVAEAKQKQILEIYQRFQTNPNGDFRRNPALLRSPKSQDEHNVQDQLELRTVADPPELPHPSGVIAARREHVRNNGEGLSLS
jgi:hypothetical protein